MKMLSKRQETLTETETDCHEFYVLSLMDGDPSLALTRGNYIKLVIFNQQLPNFNAALLARAGGFILTCKSESCFSHIYNISNFSLQISKNEF